MIDTSDAMVGLVERIAWRHADGAFFESLKPMVLFDEIRPRVRAEREGIRGPIRRIVLELGGLVGERRFFLQHAISLSGLYEARGRQEDLVDLIVKDVIYRLCNDPELRKPLVVDVDEEVSP